MSRMRTAFENMNKNRENAQAPVLRRTAAGSSGPIGRNITARERVLEVACELFAEAGFHGTHLREICKRADTNAAGVCYYFQSKEGLYQAVTMEAGRQLSGLDSDFVTSTHLPTEQRLLALTESLLKRLAAKRAWIAKLLARELVDHADNAHSYAASRLERDFVLLQKAIRDLTGEQNRGEAIRLHVLTLISECLFYSLIAKNPRHPLTQLTVTPPTRALARFLTNNLLRTLRSESAEHDLVDFNL
jgi:TetR/AcrR family transcriptional regulator, regulator of cefoperazone and chloramphenicol sensitivity